MVIPDTVVTLACFECFEGCPSALYPPLLYSNAYNGLEACVPCDVHRDATSMANKKEPEKTDEQHICRNRRAFHEYEILDKIECGVVLTGTEVKSLRESQASLEDAYAKIDEGEVWLINCDIPEYSFGTYMNHKPKRRRKLLLHRREIDKFAGRASQRGFTLVPLRLYWKSGKAKVEIAVARGKQLHDKRQSMKEADAKREMKRAMSSRGRRE
jgi:SsrA-binding protein